MIDLVPQEMLLNARGYGKIWLNDITVMWGSHRILAIVPGTFARRVGANRRAVVNNGDDLVTTIGPAAAKTDGDWRSSG